MVVLAALTLVGRCRLGKSGFAISTPSALVSEFSFENQVEVDSGADLFDPNADVPSDAASRGLVDGLRATATSRFPNGQSMRRSMRSRRRAAGQDNAETNGENVQ